MLFQRDMNLCSVLISNLNNDGFTLWLSGSSDIVAVCQPVSDVRGSSE